MPEEEITTQDLPEGGEQTETAETTETREIEAPETSETTETETGKEQEVDLAEENRKLRARLAFSERELKRREKAQQEPEEIPPRGETEIQTPGKPTPEQFEDYNDYVDALTDWKIGDRESKAKATEQKRKEAERAEQRQNQIYSMVNEGLQKYNDFDQVVFADNVEISDPMADALLECEHRHEIAYYLGSNPDISAQIAALSPISAAREIGKLEAKFAGPNPPKQKSETKAPAPTKPIGGKETPPKKLEDMNTEEFIAHRNKQEGRV